MAHLSPQLTGNPHTWTNIYIGTGIMASPQNTVYTTPSHTEPGPYAETGSYLDRNNNTSGLSSVDAPTLTGFSTHYKPNKTFNSVSTTATLTLTHIRIRTTLAKTSTWWFPIQKDLVRALNVSATKQDFKSISREGNTIKDMLVAPKDRDDITSKGGLYRGTSVTIWAVQWNALAGQVGHLGTGIRNIQELLPIYDNANTTGQSIQLDNLSIMDRESQGFLRTIKEAMFIRLYDPPPYRSLGKYQLPHSWDEVLLDTLALHLQWYPHIFILCPLGPPHWMCTHILVSMVLPGVPPHLSSPPAPHWHQILPPYSGAKKVGFGKYFLSDLEKCCI